MRGQEALGTWKTVKSEVKVQKTLVRISAKVKKLWLKKISFTHSNE